MLVLMVLEYMGIDEIDMEEEEVMEQLIRDYGPAIMLTLFLLGIDIEKNFIKGMKTWMGSPLKELVSSKEFYDLMEPMVQLK